MIDGVRVRDETPEERADRLAFAASGRGVEFTLVPDLKGRTLVDWMKRTDVVGGKLVRTGTQSAPQTTPRPAAQPPQKQEQQNDRKRKGRAQADDQALLRR